MPEVAGPVTFSCRACPSGVKHNFENMKKEKFILSKGRGICNPCHNDYEKQQRFRRMAAKNPQNFLTCDDCDKIFSKTVSGTIPKDGKKKLRVECPYCKSEDISEY